MRFSLSGLARVFLLISLTLTASACEPGPGVSATPFLITSTPSAATSPAAPVPTSAFVEATPSEPLHTQGTFVYAAGDGSLWLQDAAAADPHPLVERSTLRLAQLPAFSSDGRRVVYSTLEFLPEGNVRGDIRMIETNGENDRVVLRGEGNDIVYFYPRSVPGDAALLVARGENLQTVNERADLMWIDLETGKPRRIVQDARDADISPDGARIAFVRYDPNGPSYALWLANTDGRGARQLVSAGTFAGIQYPRFSPDGRWLAFGVHGTPARPLPLVSARVQPLPILSVEDPCWLAFLSACLVSTAQAHAAPGALWRVNLASGKFEPLTDIYDDSPAPAWSADGSQIAIHDYTGIRLVDLARHAIYPLFLEDGGSGGFDWSEK